MSKKLEIYLDLDGVVANFFKQCLTLFNRDDTEYSEWYFWKDWNLTDDEFWNGINDSPEFWAEIPTYSWTTTILSVVKYYDPEYKVLTSPHDHHTCYSGKCKWVQEHLGISVPKRCIFTKEKHLLAKKNRILIDDGQDNIKKWTDEGGIGLLFPNNINEPSKEWVGDEIRFVIDHLRLLNTTINGE